MKQDAFTGGVEPGGLWNKNDIRILICYILSSVNAPLSGDDIGKIMQEKSIANYFEVSDALAALASLGNIAQEKEYYTISDTGREIADSLDATLPLSVRDKALEAAFTLLSHARTERENKVEITQTEQGFEVKCHISGGKLDLMAITLYVPDGAQAEMVKERFHRNPGKIYRLLLASLTGDKTLVNAFLEETE